MMNLNVSLTDELVNFVKTKVESGRYASSSEVVRDALRLLEKRDREEAEKLRWLQKAWAEGADSGDFAPLADTFGMTWQFTRADVLKRVAILASRADHALQEILWRTHAGDLRADIRLVISNHADLEPVCATWGVPYHHIPVTPATREQAEEAQLQLLRGHVDLVILARYMQILSPQLLDEFPNRIINIHHSFLPAFIGANAYQGAHDRGVKLIGATAHYATEHLDAGPIIEQDVERVDHRHTVEDLRRIGRQIERSVLCRAVMWHLDDRVLVHGNKTIVFD